MNEQNSSQNGAIFDAEPSMEKISDYHKPLGSSKRKLLLYAMGAGLALGFLIYFVVLALV